MAKNEWPRLAKYMSDHTMFWGRADHVLYEMCRSMPGHKVPADIRAKVLIIGRTYAAGLERHTAGGLSTVAETVVDAIQKQQKWLDPELVGLRRLRPTPTRENIARIATVHGRLTAAVARVTRGASIPRSFVSKYLHFHAPIVPIFDSRADQRLRSRGWYPWRRTWSDDYPQPAEADQPYWRHCVRLARMAEEWVAHGFDVDSRRLDVYVLAYRE